MNSNIPASFVSNLEKAREELRTALAQVMGDRVIEVYSETHSQYDEVPTWILISPGADIKELLSIFIQESALIRKEYPSMSFSVSFSQIDNERNREIHLEFIDGRDLEDRLNNPFPDPFAEKPRRSAFENSVFQSVRSRIKTSR